MKWLKSLALMSAMVISVVAQASPAAIKHQFTEQTKADAKVSVLLVGANQTAQVTGWSADTQAMVSAALAAKDFTGAPQQIVEILAPVGLASERLLVAGVGDSESFNRVAAEKLGAALWSYLPETADAKHAVSVDARLLNNANLVAAIAHGMDLRDYRFDRYKSDPAKTEVRHVQWAVNQAPSVADHYTDYAAIAGGVFMARDIINLPGGDGYPQAIAEMVEKAVKPLGIKVTVLNPRQVERAGMGALYGVSKGSEHKAYLLALQWQGSKDAPIALVGKGNTFDTGGYNLKTSSASILRMQTDKAGGGAVIGAVMALAGQKAPVNVVAVVPLSHNLISGSALLPGDVVTAGDGTRIEVANTDAEGRLILADGIWYARDKFKPRVIADIATLTGSKVGALGTAYSAVFTEQDDVLRSMQQAGEATAELVWQLPLGPYPGIIKSNLADIANVGSPGAQAGAVFLQHFAKDTPFIHIDMAGNAYSTSANGIHPAGGNGYGVRLLTEWVKIYADIAE